jgi:hypothetical protein
VSGTLPVTIGPRLLEFQPHDFVIRDLQPVVGQRRTQDVFAQGEPALCVVSYDLGRSVKVEPLGLRKYGALADRALVGSSTMRRGVMLAPASNPITATSSRGGVIGLTAA